MGIGRALRLIRDTEVMGRTVTPSASSPSPVIRSPYTTNQLTAIVYSDIFDEAVWPITRADAMAVPAMARARNIICGFGARAPLRAYQDEVAVDPPSWTYRTDQTSMLPPYHRMVWTLDDVFFGGWCLWAVARDAENKVSDGARVPPDRWEFGRDGTIEVDDKDMPYDDVLLIPGPHEGVLEYGAGAVRHSRRLLAAASIAAETPIPNMELHDEGEEQLSDPEIAEMLAKWARARRGEDGGVAYTSKGIKAIPHGQHQANLLIEGRNAAAVDIARTASLPAALLDATLDKGSLTYETTQGRNAEALDYGVQLYLDAIAARLSMDDVVPRGTRIGFDLEAITALDVPGAAPVTED